MVLISHGHTCRKCNKEYTAYVEEGSLCFSLCEECEKEEDNGNQKIDEE